MVRITQRATTSADQALFEVVSDLQSIAGANDGQVLRREEVAQHCSPGITVDVGQRSGMLHHAIERLAEDVQFNVQAATDADYRLSNSKPRVVVPQAVGPPLALDDLSEGSKPRGVPHDRLLERSAKNHAIPFFGLGVGVCVRHEVVRQVWDPVAIGIKHVLEAWDNHESRGVVQRRD